jgi:hypothetical protein
MTAALGVVAGVVDHDDADADANADADIDVEGDIVGVMMGVKVTAASVALVANNAEMATAAREAAVLAGGRCRVPGCVADCAMTSRSCSSSCLYHAHRSLPLPLACYSKSHTICTLAHGVLEA